MLEIVKFIHEHEDWETLLSAAPYNLKISWDDGFVLFKYNQINSDFNEPICLEARGLILDSTDNFKVVRMAFKKFFNIGERFADKLDWNSAVASEKIDGSIMTLWYSRGEWHLSTNGTIDADNAELSNTIHYKNFGELFRAAAKNSGLDLSNLNSNYNYTFELVSPDNKVVISYPAPALYHLSTRDMTTLKEVAVDIGIQKPKVYSFSNENDYRKIVAQMGEGHEGIVVKDNRGNRVKIKTPLYFELHRMSNNGHLTLERAIDLIKANDTEEFLSYFTEYADYFDKVKEKIKKIDSTCHLIQVIVDTYKKQLLAFHSEKVAKKEFAMAVMKNFPDMKHLYFAAYDGNLLSKLESIPTAQYIKYFSAFLEGLNG